MNHNSLAPFLYVAMFFQVACASPAPEPGSDAAGTPALNEDSLAQLSADAARELRDSAKTTLATLLDNPASAIFDSVVVVQPPPKVDGRQPAPAVCGRIGGKPGIGGSATPARFIYQGKWTVFVEEAANLEKFAELWGGICAVPGGKVVLE